MANEEQLRLLREEGVEGWNRWREDNPSIEVNLRGANLTGANFFRVHLDDADLRGATLTRANFLRANLGYAKLIDTNLRQAQLIDANLYRADLTGANLTYANFFTAQLDSTILSDANLGYANLGYANLGYANLTRANLGYATLTRANLDYATLTRANLGYATLTRANFLRANLGYAKLIDTNLRQAQLIDANLYRADLTGANLTYANFFTAQLDSTILSDANLYRANLTRANLTRANLGYANLTGANLYRANLTRANLGYVKLTRANLTRANLTGVELENSNLGYANLTRANLTGANLISANLFRADLENANLTGANLYYANLSRVQALTTNFKGAILTGVCIENWNINLKTNLQDIICDYVYLKQNQKDRRPHDPDKSFARTEFTKRYQKLLETVDIYFGEGINWQVFLESFQKLQEEERIKIAEGEREIPIIQGIENTSDGSFVIKVGVSPDTDKGEIEKSFWQKYQRMLKEAEEKYRLELNFKDEQIQFYRQNYTQVLDIIKLTASQPINIQNKIENQNLQGDNNMTGDQKGNFGIGHMSGGEIKDNAQVAGKMNVYVSEQKQTLSEAAAEIQKLLQQLEQTNPNATPEQKEAYVNAAIPPTLKERCVSALIAGGETAIDEFFDNSFAKVGKAIVRAWIQP